MPELRIVLGGSTQLNAAIRGLEAAVGKLAAIRQDRGLSVSIETVQENGVFLDKPTHREIDAAYARIAEIENRAKAAIDAAVSLVYGVTVRDAKRIEVEG